MVRYAICNMQLHISFFFIKFGQRKLLNRIDTFRFQLLLTPARTISIKFDLIWFYSFCLCVFFFLSFKIFSILIFEGIRCFPCWHWCLRNVNKPRKATFQRHRQRQPHPAQMEHQMANRIHLPKIFKHLSKCLRKKIGHSWQIMPNLMAWWVWAQQKIH